LATPIPVEKINVPPNSAATEPSDRSAIPATVSTRQPASALDSDNFTERSQWRGSGEDQQRQCRQQSRRSAGRTEARPDRLEQRSNAGERRTQVRNKKKERDHTVAEFEELWRYV
jgi:hypothetical protein